MDLSRLDFDDAFLPQMAGPMAKALEAMRWVEAGAEANPDEQRMVGYYWLRHPALAPSPELREVIAATVEDIAALAESVHQERTVGERGPFRHALVVGGANGMLGYLPTREAFRHGGYETTLGPPSRMAPETGDRLADEAIRLIASRGECGTMPGVCGDGAG